MTKAVELTQGKVALVDDDDYEWVKDIPWYFDKGHGYATATVGGRLHKKHIKLHRVIMGEPEGMFVDHINRVRLDCRKENLRIVTPGQSVKNKGKYADNGTKYMGVSYREDRSKWIAQIQCDGKHFSLGMYKQEIVAAVAYDRACRDKFKEYGNPNFPDEVFEGLWEQYKELILNPKRRQGSSKHVGVYWSTRDKVWRAQVVYKKKVYPVGTFKTEEEAAKAREEFKAKMLNT